MHMRWYVIVAVILLIPILMITCQRPNIAGTWLDYEGIEQRAFKAGSGMTLGEDGTIHHLYETTNGEKAEMTGRYEFRDGRLFVVEETAYVIDANGVRTDHPPQRWSAQIEFESADEMVLYHPTQGKVYFRREAP